MKFYLIESKIKESTEKDAIRELMPAHQQFVHKAFESGRILFSGPVVPLGTGGVFITKAESFDDLEQFFAEDPFIINGLVTYRFVEFMSAKCSPALKEWFEL